MQNSLNNVTVYYLMEMSETFTEVRDKIFNFKIIDFILYVMPLGKLLKD